MRRMTDGRFCCLAPAAALLLAAVAAAQPALPMHHELIEPGPQEWTTLYATGQRVPVETYTQWKLICGSDDSAITRQEFLQLIDMTKAAAANVQDEGLSSRGGLDLVFSVSGTVPAGASAALTDVENYIESRFSDPITVTISINFATMSAGILGATGSQFVTNSWSNTRAGLVNDMDPTDTIQLSLPSGTTIPVRYNGSSSSASNENAMDATRANHRAAIGTSSGLAASMTINTNVNWDWDPSNGVGSRTCFQSVLVHEVGHALGFVSKADDGTAEMDVLDAYRFQDSDGAGDFNPDTIAEFTTTPRLVDFNNPDDDHNSDIITNQYAMSDGSPWQASHFREQGSNIGIMDPAMSPGQSFYPNFYRASDLNMLDAIGWDYPPISLSLVPTANDDAFTVPENAPFLFTRAQLFSNDEDPDNDPFMISSFTQPAHGGLVDNGDSTFTYTPDTEFNGADAFTYTLTDNDGSDTATVTLSVVPVSSIIFVDQTAVSGGNSGLSWPDAFVDLQTALAAASPGDQVWVAAGAYRPTGARTSTFTIPAGVEVYGAFPVGGGSGTFDARNFLDAANSTVLSGDINEDDSFGGTSDNAYHVVTFAPGADGSTVLDGFHVLAGNANGGGTDQDRGGGILLDDVSPTLTNLVLLGNNAAGPGGGIYGRQYTALATNLSVFGNTAGTNGGGAAFEGGAPMLINVLFNGNAAGADGGAIHASGAPVDVLNSTLNRNSAGGAGGAVLATGPGAVEVRNTILYANDAPSGGQLAIRSGAVISVAHCIVQGGQAGVSNSGGTLTWLTGNIDQDPALRSPLGFDGVPGTGDERAVLAAGSPAIDAGNNGYLPAGITEDIEGSARKVDATNYANVGVGSGPIVDIGAFEAVVATPLAAPGDLDLRLTTTIYDAPPRSTDAITVVADGEPISLTLYVEARVSGDAAATGMTTFDAMLRDDLSGSFAPALLSNDEAAELPAGTFPGNDADGRAGLLVDYRALVGGGAGNGLVGNGGLVNGAWAFLPISISPSGVPEAVNQFDTVYKFTWSTDDLTPRTVNLNVQAQGGAYQASPGGLQQVPFVGAFTLPVTIVASSASCPCEADGNDAQVDVFDLLAYLDLWFVADPGAERTGDAPASVDVFDLLTFLDCWFPASAGSPCP